MKVTYTQNRFEIDGVKIINPELLLLGSVQLNFDVKKWAELKDGESFPLPDNIIAEKMDRCKVCGSFENENCKGSYYGCDVSNVTVYRLKLKEPLVDTGSKESIDIEAIVKSVSYNVELQSGEKLIVVDYDDALFMMQELYKKVK